MKTLLVDDHPLILSALQTVIRGLRNDVELITAQTAEQARDALARSVVAFDLVLLDLYLGDADGFELLVELRETYPALSVVVVSASDRSTDIMRSIELGAMGFVPKRSSNDQLFAALNLVMSGGIYVPPMAMRSMSSAAPSAMADAAPPAVSAQRSLASCKLTPRQTDVLHLLLRGQSNKLIARELNLSVETIKDHVAAVLRALGVASRTQAVLAVSQMSEQGMLLARHEPIPHQSVVGQSATAQSASVHRPG